MPTPCVIDADRVGKLLLNGIVIKSHSSCLGCWVMYALAIVWLTPRTATFVEPQSNNNCNESLHVCCGRRVAERSQRQTFQRQGLPQSRSNALHPPSPSPTNTRITLALPPPHSNPLAPFPLALINPIQTSHSFGVDVAQTIITHACPQPLAATESSSCGRRRPN